MAGVDLALRATVFGKAQIVSLNAELKKLRINRLVGTRAAEVARKQMGLAMGNLREQNSLVREQLNLSKEQRFFFAKDRMEQKRLLDLRRADEEVMERAVKIRERRNMTVAQSVQMAETQIRQERVSAIATKARNELLKEQVRLESIRRQELMQASIGMFVMGITMTQTLGVMEQMAGTGTRLGNVFKAMSQGVRFMLGPIQVVTSALQFMNMVNKQMMLTMTRFMLILGGVFILFKAFTSQGRLMRFVLGSIAGALLILNAKLLINTARTWASTIAKIVNISVSTLGTALPVLAAAVAGGLAIGLAAMATAPKGQTTMGFIRPIRQTGLFYGHRGEGVGQIGSMVPSGGERKVVININIESGAVVDEPLITKMSRELEMAAASGGAF